MDALVFFQLLLYILGSILLVVLIVLSIKFIFLMDRMSLVIDSIEKKVNSLNGFFNILDLTTDKLSALSDRFIDVVTSAVRKIFKRKGKEEDEYEK